MQFLQNVLFALLAFSCASIAAPTVQDNDERSPLTVSIEKKRDLFWLPNSEEIDFAKVTQNLNQLKAKYTSAFDSYKANTGLVHPLAILGDLLLPKRATGSVPLTDVQDSLWHGAITLGGQTFECDFDTGALAVSSS